MDPALLRERERFKKRALAQPAVENRKASKHASSDGPSKKKHKSSRSLHRPKVAPAPEPFDYKRATGPSNNRFSILAKVVNFMKSRHHSGDTHPLAMDEILEEAKMTDISPAIKTWLGAEALLNNPKLEVKDGDTFVFKPRLPIRNRKGLLSLLKRNDLKGLGTVFMEDVEEAVPQAQKHVEKLKDQILVITRMDKKKILVTNDKSSFVEISEVYRQHWNSASTADDEQKIEEYLTKHGITSMQDMGVKRVAAPRNRRGGNKKRPTKKLNDHMGDTLVDYT